MWPKSTMSINQGCWVHVRCEGREGLRSGGECGARCTRTAPLSRLDTVPTGVLDPSTRVLSAGAGSWSERSGWGVDPHVCARGGRSAVTLDGDASGTVSCTV